MNLDGPNAIESGQGFVELGMGQSAHRPIRRLVAAVRRVAGHGCHERAAGLGGGFAGAPVCLGAGAACVGNRRRHRRRHGARAADAAAGRRVSLHRRLGGQLRRGV